MSYVVLARKWRPRQFEEVVGQEHVARTLANAIEQDRVAHAFLFTGARGVGKTSTARILAKALNCEKGPTPTPCNECSACVEITTGQSVDVFEIDGASNRGINEIRELRESVRYAPSRSKYKVYIIDEVHMLTTEAFNALLKTLEEPPPHVKFIFATTEPQKIPVTILSRCQRYDFKRIGQQDIVRHLEILCAAEKIEAEKTALQIIARQAAGGMRDALSLLDQIISFAGNTVSQVQVNEILGVANRQHLFDLSEAVLQRDAERALLVLDEVNRYGYDLPQFASELVGHFRDLMVISVVRAPERVTDMTVAEIDSARVQIQGVPSELLHRCFTLMVAGSQEMTRSAYPKLILEMTLIRLAQLEPMVGLDLIVDKLAALEAEFDGEPLPPRAISREPLAPAPSDRRTEARPSASPTERGGTATKVEAPEPDDEPEPAGSGARRSASESRDVGARGSDSDIAKSGASDLGAQGSAHVVALSEPSESEYDDDGDSVLMPPEPVREYAPLPGERVQSVPSSAAPIEPLVVTGTTPTEMFAFGPEEEVPVASINIEILHPAEIDMMSPMERRDKLVEVVRRVSKPIAAVLEYAYVEAFGNHTIELSLHGKFLRILEDNHRVERLREVVRQLFGEKWVLDLQTRDDVRGASVTTIVEERERERAARRSALEQELRGSLAVRKAQELFNVPEERVRVQVKLFDDF